MMYCWTLFLWTLFLWTGDANAEVTPVSTVSNESALVEVHDVEYSTVQRVVNRTVRRIQRRRIMGSVVLISYKGDVIYLDRRGWQNTLEDLRCEV